MNRDEKLRQIFLAPDMKWLGDRLRNRTSRGKSLIEATLTNACATEAERTALDNFLGRKSTRPGATLTVTLAALTRQLRHAELIDDLSDVVHACFGEVANEREIRNHIGLAWNAVFSDALENLEGDLAGRDWIESLRADGLLKRFSKSDPDTGRNLIEIALKIWKQMPYDGITLAELGGKITGDTHALDRGRGLSPILLRGLKFRTSYEGNKNAALRRRAWDAVGVVIDRLSSPVLTFNLRAQSNSVLGGILALHAESELPVYLTYQMVQAHGPFPFNSAMSDIFVVENPSIIESAASTLGAACRPLICTEGIPASAVKLLLSRLAQAGHRIHIRADFDWTGLRIVDQLLLAIPNAKPWKMDVETYQKIEGTVELAGKRFSAPWCADLVETMNQSGVAVYEEQLTGELLKGLNLNFS